MLRLAAAILTVSALPQNHVSAAEPLRIGVPTDMSGPFADIGGQGSVEAARLGSRTLLAEAEIANPAGDLVPGA